MTQLSVQQDNVPQFYGLNTDIIHYRSPFDLIRATQVCKREERENEKKGETKQSLKNNKNLSHESKSECGNMEKREKPLGKQRGVEGIEMTCGPQRIKVVRGLLC